MSVSFLGIQRTTKLPNNFWYLHCYGVTLVKKCNKPLLQIRETKIFDQKRFIKDLFKVNEKDNSGVLGINQTMSNLLTLSKRFQLNYQQITAVVCMGVQKIAPEKNFPSVRVRIWFRNSVRIRAGGQFSQNHLHVTLYFELAEHSHISHFTYHLRYYIIIDNVLTSYIK